MIFNVFQGSHKGVEVPGHDSAWRGPYLGEQNVGEAHAVSGLQTRSGECVKTYRSLGTKRMGDICPLFCQVIFWTRVHVQLKTNFVFILIGFFFNSLLQILKSQLSHHFCKN